MSRLDLTLAREFEAALAWWQAAGVDCDFNDDATAWLAEAPLDAPMGQPQPRSGQAQTAPRPGEPQPRRAATPSALQAEPAAAPRPNLLGDSPPADLAAFRRFWMEAPGLAPATGFPRVPPRGDAGAALMVLVPQPEAEDAERLLSGPQGRLLGAILAAMGLGEGEVYIAAALPCHTPMADLAALAAGGLDAVTAHHVSLARPQRLVAFGTGLASLLGTPDDALREINQSMRNTPVLVGETLDAMMHMAPLKARFWRRWMEWSPTV
ncbi:hypothetical protein ACLBKU_10020 [Erythrobacter sp. NE805]|uniref:hypothetical protein n=1 Tax=Erythrobacter sp. NE805 TaxID=3389875 RepID=UPI00396AFE38